MVMNHHAASSTEWPTVSRPWLRKMTALRSPSAWAMRFPSSVSSTTPVKSSNSALVLVEGADVLGDGFEQSAHGRPGLAVDSNGRGRRRPRRAGPRGPASGWRRRRC